MLNDVIRDLEAEVICLTANCKKTRWVPFDLRHGGNKNLPKDVERAPDAHCEFCANYGEYTSGYTVWTGRTRWK